MPGLSVLQTPYMYGLSGSIFISALRHCMSSAHGNMIPVINLVYIHYIIVSTYWFVDIV